MDVEMPLSSALLLPLLVVAIVRMLEDAEREAEVKSEMDDGLRAEAMNTANAMMDLVPFWVLCMNYD